MFTEININDNDTANLNLFDTHDIVVNRNGNDAEIVIHPCNIGKVTVRYAKETYSCRIHLADGIVKTIDLGDESDWGNIQQMNPGDTFIEGRDPEDWFERIGWGNDEDGHIEIVKVEYLDGIEIPLDEFKQDIADFIIYYEA